MTLILPIRQLVPIGIHCRSGDNKCMARFTALLVAGVLALPLTGCGPNTPQQSPTAPPPSASIAGDWMFTSGTDSAGAIPADTADILMTIDGGSIGGRICNSWGGDVTIDGSSISIGAIAATEMYCTGPEGIMKLETRFLDDIGAVTMLEATDGMLSLSGDGVQLIFARVD